ncbi:MAG: hypothetical protein ACK4TF_01445 [Thermodesulfovibrionales bacterium]
MELLRRLAGQYLKAKKKDKSKSFLSTKSLPLYPEILLRKDSADSLKRALLHK